MPPDEPIDPTAGTAAPGAAEAVSAASDASPAAGTTPAAEPSADTAGAGGGEAAAVTPHTDTPTLLEEGAEPEPAAQEEKAPDAAPEPEKPVEEKPAEPKPADPPAPDPEAPVVYEFTLPDGIKADAEQMTAYTEVLREHRVPPEAGQRLIDMHTAALRDYADRTLESQHRAFADTRKSWRDQIMGDEQLGGAGFKTVSTKVAQMRDLFVPEADRQSFNDFLRATGAGDHPAFWRLLHNAARLFGEPSPPPADAKPAPNQGAPNSRLRGLYTHPTSGPREG